jgi:hypothetical protein
VTSPAHAALDPEAKKPYQLQIVLHIGANRLFTPLFQEQLQRDLANHLKLAFGNLAHIEIKRTHELLRDIETRGLEQALERFDKLSGQTTHFVLLDYAAGSYRIQTRFHDGMTAQAGPLTRRTDTNDRSAAALAIAQLIETSFCPVGTVTAVGKDVTLKLQGGDLGVPLDRWVQRGHVFSVSRISKHGGQERAQRLEWAALEVLDMPQPGVCRCRYWHRYQEDALREGAATLGFRALRLPTTAGPVKIQLLDDTTLQPLDGVRVQVSRPGAGKPVELLTNRDGLAVTRESFDHLALVQVLSGATIRAQFPVELIDGRTVVARVKIQADAESLAPLEVRRDAWLRRAYDNVRMSSERTHELALQLNQSLEAALESSRKSLPLLEAEVKYLDQERDELKELATQKKAKFNMREGEQQIDELRKQAVDLQDFVQRLEKALTGAGDEKSLGLTKLLERARLLESEADFDPAIRLYEQVVQASPEQSGKVREHLAKLKAAWTAKSERHAAERKFVYQDWPKIDVAELQKNLVRAKEAFATCKDNGDKLTVQKLLRVNVVHMTNLKKELDTLKRLQGEDNRNRRSAQVQVSEALLALHNEAVAFVNTRKE